MKNSNEITLNLTTDEVKFIQQVLGDLPSRTGAAFLMKKIKEQTDSTDLVKSDPS